MARYEGYIEIEWKLLGGGKGFRVPDGKTQRFDGEDLIISFPPNKKFQLRMKVVNATRGASDWYYSPELSTGKDGEVSINIKKTLEELQKQY